MFQLWLQAVYVYRNVLALSYKPCWKEMLQFGLQMLLSCVLLSTVREYWILYENAIMVNLCRMQQ